MPKKIGDRVRKIREELEMSQVSLAEKANLSQSTVSAIESSTKIPSGDTLLSLASALETVPSELLGEKCCSVCGFEYTYDEGLNSKAHAMQHGRVEHIIRKYGFYLPYRDRTRVMQHAQEVFENPQASVQKKTAGALMLFKAFFSRSVFAYGRDDHPDFDTYIKMMLHKGIESFTGMPPDVFKALEKHYGHMAGMETGSYYQHAISGENMFERDPRLEKIVEALGTLPAPYVDIIAFICEQAQKTAPSGAGKAP